MPLSAAKKRNTYHHGALREQLISSALELLEEVGPNDLSIREVARRGGVSHAAPYRHFADKEALIAALMEEGYRDLSIRMTAAAAKHPGDPASQLNAAGVAYVELALARPALFRLMFSRNMCDFGKFESLSRTAKEAFEILAALVGACYQAGSFKQADPQRAVMACWALTHGLSTLLLERQLLMIPGAEENPLILAAELNRLLMEGLCG